MSKSVKNWYKELSRKGKASVICGTLLASIVLGAAGADNGSPKTATSAPKPITTVQPQPVTPKITHQTVTATESIPFSATTQNDPSLTKGVTKTITAGANGVRTYTFDVTYTDGVETARKETSNVLTTPPVNQVVAIGTYVAPAPASQLSCPSGTYINSAGNSVCSPYSSSSAPSGATARCSDGTYSFSQSRSGTCSHHGGVAEWL